MKKTGITISDIYDLKDGKLTINQKKLMAKKPVCARFPKRKHANRYGKRAASSVNRPV
jgi:hypothetical protein